MSIKNKVIMVSFEILGIEENFNKAYPLTFDFNSYIHAYLRKLNGHLNALRIEREEVVEVDDEVIRQLKPLQEIQPEIDVIECLGRESFIDLIEDRDEEYGLQNLIIWFRTFLDVKYTNLELVHYCMFYDQPLTGLNQKPSDILAKYIDDKSKPASNLLCTLAKIKRAEHALFFLEEFITKSKISPSKPLNNFYIISIMFYLYNFVRRTIEKLEDVLNKYMEKYAKHYEIEMSESSENTEMV